MPRETIADRDAIRTAAALVAAICISPDPQEREWLAEDAIETIGTMISAADTIAAQGVLDGVRDQARAIHAEEQLRYTNPATYYYEG